MFLVLIIFDKFAWEMRVLAPVLGDYCHPDFLKCIILSTVVQDVFSRTRMIAMTCVSDGIWRCQTAPVKGGLIFK